MPKRLIVRGPGMRGVPGRDGLNVVPTDEAFAGLVTDDASDTRAALSATFASLNDDGELVVNGDVIETGGGASALDDLTDVSTAGAVDGQVLTFDQAAGTYRLRAAQTGPRAFGGLTPGMTRAQIPQYASDGGQPQAQTRLRHVALTPLNFIRFVYVNYMIDGTVSGLSPITVKAALEDPYGGTLPMTFNGQRSVTIDPGGMVISDPVSIDSLGPAGPFPYYWSRTLVTCAVGGGKWAAWTWGSGGAAQTGDSYEYGSSLTDKTLNDGALTTGGLNGGGGFGPAAIIADAPGRRACVFGRGDSIVAGDSDNGSGSVGGVSGYLARALAAAGIPNILVGKAGEQAIYAFNNVGTQGNAIGSGSANVYSRINSFASGCSHIYAEHGVNDLNTGIGNKSLSAFKTIIAAYWQHCANRNAKVIAPTLTPSTTSSDGWATTGNQTIAAVGNNTARTAFNDWLRAGAALDPSTKAPVDTGTPGALVIGALGHPLFAYDEIADRAETARNSGIWKAGYTSDGVHPNATGAAALALGVDVSHFTV